MCCLAYPFVGNSLNCLAKEIVHGTYADLPDHYSKDMSFLMQALLKKKGSERPSINQLLAFPLIKCRIEQLLTNEQFKDEFSHTILHGRDVFAEHAAKKDRKKIKQKKLKVDTNDRHYEKEGA